MVSMDKKAESCYRGPDLKLFVRDVSDRQGKKRPITVRSWSTIKDVKDSIQKVLKVPTHAQRLYFGPLLTRELPNHRTLHDAGIYRSGETLLLDIKGTPESSSPSPYSSMYSLRSSSVSDICISSSVLNSTPKALRAIATEARRGFALGIKPELGLDGSGGTYFLHDARKNRIAVFKPADEEPYAENNPRGYLLAPGGEPMSMRDGIAPGEACIREVAAYLLDHGGVSGVPMTTLAEARHPAFNMNGSRLKVAEGGAAVGSHSISPNPSNKTKTQKKAGSFQEFVRSECTIDDISHSKIEAEEIHKIAILDIRIMNADRNSANLLVRRATNNALKLVPIDHGYCLRTCSDVSWMDWCWLDWPQLKMPISDKLKKYVLDLDIEADARLLSEQLAIPQEAIDIFRASSSLLKAGVRAGLTLYDIAILCCRNDNLAEVPSVLEKLVDMASELAHIAIENERWHHVAASRALVEQLSPSHKRRCSAFSRMSSMDSGSLHKSISSTEFVTTSRRTSDGATSSLLREALEAGASRTASPAMAQSSASDSSSEAADADGNQDGNVEKDECEEWAASVILDVSVDQIKIPSHRGHRSGSFISDDGSSDSLSSSPKGFWHIRPGSSTLHCSDNDSVTWSPQASPHTSLHMRCSEDLPPPVDIGVAAAPASLRPPSITFAPCAIGGAPGPFLSPPATVNVSALKNKPGIAAPIPRRMDNGMSRSKSYAALSAASTGANGVAHASAPKQKKVDSEDYETYRKYFHKFIDLVIVRETTAAFHNASRHGSEDLTTISS